MSIAKEDILSSLKEMIVSYYPELEGKELLASTPITGETGIDSLGFVFVAAKLENKYGIKIPNRAMSKFVTLGDVTDFVFKKVR